MASAAALPRPAGRDLAGPAATALPVPGTRLAPAGPATGRSAARAALVAGTGDEAASPFR